VGAGHQRDRFCSHPGCERSSPQSPLEKKRGAGWHNDRATSELVLTYQETADILKISVAQLYQMVSRGQIKVVQWGGKSGKGTTRFRPKDLQEFVDKHVTTVNG
jgi:excisionase family DNA binding protein